MEYSLLKDVTHLSHRWRIRVRITRVNEYKADSPQNKILRLNFVLLDEMGDTMEGQVLERHVEQFRALLHENHVYHIEYFEVAEAKNTYRVIDRPIMARFTRHTKIKEVTPVPDTFPCYAYTLATFDILRKRIGEKQFLSDTIGLVTAVSYITKVYPNGIEKSVRNIQITDGREKTTVALWGTHAHEFDAERLQMASVNAPVVILFVGLTVKLYAGQLSLQGSTVCRWYPNAPISEIVALQNNFPAIPHEIKWLGTRPREDSPKTTTVAELSVLNAHDAVGLTYVVNITIKSLVPHESWWYMSCGSCRRTANQDGAQYNCPRCPGIAAEPRYKLAILGVDPSNATEDDAPTAEFVFFGDMGQQLLHVPVLALTSITSTVQGIIPPQITNLYGRRYTLKGNWCHEYRKLKAKIETIQKCHKHLMGEDLESLNLKELQQLEQQLESSLKHIRSRKSHLMIESISELQKKERSLQEENKALQKELVERQKVVRQQQVQWDQTQVQIQPPQAQASSSSSSIVMRDQQALNQPQNIYSYPPMTMGDTGEAAAAPGQSQIRIGGLPPWMLSHLNV